MGVVYLPICPVCRWSMRLVRVSDGDGTRKVRVFECIRCHNEMIWAPESNRVAEPTSSAVSVRFFIPERLKPKSPLSRPAAPCRLGCSSQLDLPDRSKR
jgi:hypothetical protein